MLKKSISADVVLNEPKIHLPFIDLLYLCFICILSILFVHEVNVFNFDKFSAVVFIFFIVASLIYQLVQYKHLSKMNWGIWIFMLLSIVPNIIYPYHYMLKVANLLFVNIVLAYWFLSCANHRINGASEWIVMDILHAILHAPCSLLSVVSSFIKENLISKCNYGQIVKIVIGIIISVPFLVVIILLLSRSDDTFYHYVSYIQMDFTWAVNWGVTLVFAFPLFFYYSAMSYGNLSKSHIKLYDEESEKKKFNKLSFVPQQIFTTMQCLLVLTYLIFIIASIQSLISTVGNSKEYFSYSQYARQGFFELCAIAFINLVLLFSIRLIAKGKNAFSFGIEKILILETMILIVSVMSKLIMYIYVYEALTYLRIYAGWFIIVLFGVFMILLLQKETSRYTMQAIVYYVSICFLLLNLMNVSYWASDSMEYTSNIGVEEYYRYD